MLIWGSRASKKTVGRGEFFCPGCRESRSYEEIWVRRQGHVFWIPLFSYGTPVHYVECQTCNRTYDRQVLELTAPPTEGEFSAKYEEGMLRVMISIMLADGRVDEREQEMIKDVYGSFTKKMLPQGKYDSAVEDARKSSATLYTYLAELEPYLNSGGKEAVIKAALAVAAADGNLDESEGREMRKIGTALQMSDAHLRGVIAEMFPSV